MTISRLTFDSFCLDLGNQRLVGPQGVVALRPKAFAVLQYLAQHPGRLVQKAELLQACWPGVVVGDAVLKGCIREIREALSDSAAAPRFIKTQSRFGYWFVAAVRPFAPDAVAPSVIAPSVVVPSVVVPSGVPPQAAATQVSVASAGPVRSRAVVGRDAELARLAECLALADAGEAQLVLVSGEAGAGKTALVDAFVQRGLPGGALVGRGQCIEQHGPSESYLPWLAALRELADHLDPRQMSERLLRDAPTWLRQLPALAQGIDRERLQHAVIGAGRERMLREGAEGLAVLAPEHCLVLVLEDLQWADAATIELLTYLMQRRSACRLLLIATARETEATELASLARLRSLGARGLAVNLALSPLPVSAVKRLIGQRLPPLTSDLIDRLAVAVHGRTEGNPLFVAAVLDELWQSGLPENLLRSGTDEFPLRWVERSLPASIRALAEQMVASLPTEDQRTLEAASIVGDDSTSAAIAAALRQAPADLEPRLEALCRRRQLLKSMGVAQQADGQVWGRYQFVHALFRDVLYGRIGAFTKANYHLNVGEYLVAQPQSMLIINAANIAYHFESGGDFLKSIHWLVVLAWQEVMHLGDRAAERHLNHALTLAESVSGEQGQACLLSTLEQRALISARLGRLQSAVQDYERIVQLAEEWAQLAWQARGLADLAALLSWVAPARAIHVSERAVLLSERHTDDTLQIRARGLRGFLRCLFADEWSPADAEASLRSSQVRPGEAVLPAGNPWNHGVQVQSLFGDYEGSRANAQRGIELALRQNDANEYLFLRFHQSGALFFLGRFGEALDSLADAQQIAQRNGDISWAAMLGVGQACIEVQCFAFSDAIAHSQSALEFASKSPVRLRPLEIMSQSIVALALAGEGKLSASNHALLAMTADEPLSFNTRMTLLIAQLEIALTGGDVIAVAQRAKALLALTQPPGEPTGIVWARRGLALVASQSGRWDEAESELAQAAAVLAQKPAPVAAWRLHLAAAEIYTAQGRLDLAGRAREQCAEALGSLSRSLAGWAALRRAFHAYPAVAQILEPPTSSLRRSRKPR